MRNSARLIKEAHPEIEKPRIAFSTTNYHVLRSGLIATSQGIAAEGIGSPTRTYFWINAFIREFIANLVAEKKKHLETIGILAAILSLLATALYFSNNH